MNFKSIVIILTSCYCILSFTLHCCKFGVVKNHALFGVNIFSLKIWSCSKDDIFQVCRVSQMPLKAKSGCQAKVTAS